MRSKKSGLRSHGRSSPVGLPVAGGPSPHPTLESILAEIKTHYSQGDMDRVWDLCEQILFADPNHIEGLHFSTLVCLSRADYPQAVERLTRAVSLQPNQSVFVMNLGVALMGMQRWEDAFNCFTRLIALRPESAQAYCHLGRVLWHQKKEGEAILALQKALQLNPEYALAHDLMSMVLRGVKILPLASYHKQLEAYYAKRAMDEKEATPQHTLFMDRERARHTASQSNLVPETIQGSGLQLCFYLGEPFTDAPSNLVAVPATPSAFIAFFSTMTFSDPTRVDFNPDSPQERDLAGRFARLLNDARIVRFSESKQWHKRCEQTQPRFGTGEPLRVFVPTARQLDVMKYNARDLAQAFRRLGCDTLFYLEEDHRHTFDLRHYYETLALFNPHIVVDINDYFKLPLHPDVFKVVWVQDPMPSFMNGPFPWRKRDVVCSAAGAFDNFLHESGVQNLHRRYFCYDEEIFFDDGQQKRDKAVVVASTYHFVFGRFPGSGPLIDRMREMFIAGEKMTDHVLGQLALTYGYKKEDILYHIFPYVVRNQSVRWLCELSDEIGIEVEVYGNQWEKEAQVRPFHKGILPHGPLVAKVYNEARYVLVAQPASLQSQRLVELAACGATPVMYDCRDLVEPFQWGQHCLWYNTKAEMRNCLAQTPPASPKAIAQGASFLDFAQWILAQVEGYLLGNGEECKQTTDR